MAPCKLGSIALLVAISLTLGCSSNSTPTPTSPTTRATVGIAALSVVGERASAGGYTYRVVLHLRESAGAAATISAADLTFMNGANALMSSHHEQTIPSTGNVVPANGAADTRELVTTDTNATDPYATSVLAKVTYTGGASGEATGLARFRRLASRRRPSRTPCEASSPIRIPAGASRVRASRRATAPMPARPR